MFLHKTKNGKVNKITSSQTDENERRKNILGQGY